MVGLVIVAHSRALAEALVGLVRQVASEQVPMVIAAGAGKGHLDFGTDAAEIAEAVQAVYSPAGVAILVDMGSAILSAEMALEFLPEEMRGRVVICSAPLVEGTIAAAVQASLGSDLKSVRGEAQRALEPKIEHLAGNGQGHLRRESLPAGAERTLSVRLENPHGLHARPAARFVQTAGAYQAEVWVTNLTNGKGPVSARSLNSLTTLGAVKDSQLRLQASGPEAVEVLEALQRLVESHFGEETAAYEEPVELSELERSPGNPMQGIAISEGIALGALFYYRPARPPLPDYQPQDPQVEWESLQRALEVARLALQEHRQKLSASLGDEKAAIFDAHRLILEDPDLLELARERIFTGGQNAARAWQASLAEVAERYESLEDPYQKKRQADVLDAGNQVLIALAGGVAPGEIIPPEDAVVYAAELTPGEVSQIDSRKVLGLVTARGDKTAHSAILSRAMGLPALSGIDLAELGVQPGTPVAVDGFRGLLWVDPGLDVLSELTARRQDWMDERSRLLSRSHAPAMLRDGRRMEVAANVGSLADARAAALNGADGVGVLRTEFLYLKRLTPPGEDEQCASLGEVAQLAGNKPVIVRTLDIGGDKSLPYIQQAAEANPFLGVRAIRLSLAQPELFLTQLRAILRAGADHDLHIMYPMIANLEEIMQARELLERAHQALLKESLPHRWPIQMGIMVEIPSAALLSNRLAPHVDFFSIGTNDLTQYTLAAERGNARLAGYLDGLHPAVLRLVRQVVDAAHQYGKWAGVCGEIAADPLAVPVLAGLGVDELSMNPADIPRAKEVIREMDPAAASALAEKALTCASPQEVRDLVLTWPGALPARPSTAAR
jgi:multiphosphoryl transfer protein